jgi:hypothetical protein
VGLYRICAILVLLYALSVLYGVGAEAASPRVSDFLIPALWLSLPVGVSLVQLWRPTLLGWFLLTAGFVGAAFAVSYLLINDRVGEPWPLFVLAILVTTCVGLVRKRPLLSTPPVPRV